MTQVLSKGANAPLTGTSARVEIASSTPLDIAALLVTASGKVRSDDDFIFYNQPNGPGVRLVPPSRLDFELGRVPADIDKIVLTGSLDGTGPLTFAGVRGLSVSVRDGGGAEVARFDPTDLANETALILAEVYRRQGAWKVRAVGQGYAAGLAGIATDFGITVDDSPPAAATPTPAPPPRSANATARLTTPIPAAAPPPPSRSAAPASGGMVNLDKGKVSLAKGQSVSLVKTGAPPLTKVRMALGWDPTERGNDIDLDASVILFDGRGKDVDKVWFMSKKGARGAVRHSGDNLTGDGSGDDETIFVDLAALPNDITALIFTVNSFQGQRFTEVRNAYCRLIDDTSNQELARFDLSESKPNTGLVMSKIQRGANGWVMTAIGEFHDGKTVRAMTGPARRYL